MEISEVDRSARVVVPDNKLSLAIGRRGQNARLAAKLTGWKVDIKSESEAGVSIDELFKPEARQLATEEGVAGGEIFTNVPSVHPELGEALLTEADAPVAETTLLQEAETDGEVPVTMLTEDASVPGTDEVIDEEPVSAEPEPEAVGDDEPALDEEPEPVARRRLTFRT